MAALLLPAVGAAPTSAGQVPPSDRLQRAFAEAAAEYDVPQNVLLAVSYLQSRWDQHDGAPSVAGGYGPMHLTDARTALARAPHHSHGKEDPRGDSSRGTRNASETPLPTAAQLPERLKTLAAAAKASGIPEEELRSDPYANVRGGAALLAAAQRTSGGRPSEDPADWYAAVDRFTGADADADDSAGVGGFADEVFTVLRQGQHRTNDAGQRLTLKAERGLPARPAAASSSDKAVLRPGKDGGAECPSSVNCEWIPAPYEEFGEGDYGNHDLANRPHDQKIDSIVVHDTEGTWDVALKLVQDPTYVSWHYTLRSTDGHIAQHLRTKDAGWHAGNWYINSHSVGLEHEGFLTSPDAWYTEQMYRSSARLVKYLAHRFDIPLDRQHILGHDTVPGTTTSTIAGMHTDPGPYWDWEHYFALMGKPLHPNTTPDSEVVTIAPGYDSNKPVYTGCTAAGKECTPHGSSAVRAHTEPREDAPLVKDIGLRPGGGPTTTGVNDTGARLTAGQSYAVAERRGDWTAVWYLGQKAWIQDPADRPVTLPVKGTLVTPKDGRADIPVYGRAYPEKEAYPAGVPVQSVSPLPYKLPAGQSYVSGGKVDSEYFYAPTFDTKPHRVVRGKDKYYEIQFGHRVAYVRAADVDVRRG